MASRSVETLLEKLYNFSVSDLPSDAKLQSDLLRRREDITSALLEDPYSITLYLARSDVHAAFGYSDLAAADAYKALLLVDEVTDESGEYHEEAVVSLSAHIKSLPISHRKEQASTDEDLHTHFDIADDAEVDVDEEEAILWAQSVFSVEAPLALAHHLASIGCLRTACEYVQNLLTAHPSSLAAQRELHRIHDLASIYFSSSNTPFDPASFDLQALPDQGSVRREVYPWNTHEADRNAPAALEFLNAEMQKVAPKLQVRVTELPNLADDGAGATIKQLGVFALHDIAPGEEILHERSLLTANSSLHEPLCDACSAALPPLSSRRQDTIVSCPECADTVFCSASCLALAQASYHPAVCGADGIEALARVAVSRAEAPTAMYTLLVLRALAMSLTQEAHPLDLAEVRYIWGDFVASHDRRTLPFTFASHVLTPLHFLTLLDVDVFRPSVPGVAELWVLNTLFAKLRATASARMHPRTGTPEVAAVHPLWCLANHSCDPNVGWEWAGEVRFVSRTERVAWGGRREEPGDQQGKVMIRAGDEILNHYVDVGLPVKERREWGAGALGGMCMCERCVWEAARDEEKGV